MKTTIRDSQSLQRVHPEDLGQYLSAHRWRNQRPFGEFGAVYNHTKGARKYELLVPLTREIDDFPQRIHDILRTLEKVEERSQTEILSDLTSIHADVVRIRRAGAFDGTLPLEDGAGLFTSAFEMVKAAACTAVAPRFYYQGNRPGQVTEYLRKARLGQSERGSYVLTVISPLPPPSKQTALLDVPDPFERKVTRLISRGLQATVEASEYALRTAKTDHFRESTSEGISANLLDAVLGLIGADHQSVGVSFAWSPEIPVEEDPSRIITLEPDFAPVIEKASKFLKSQEAQEPIELVGVVVGLRREEGETRGRVTMSAVIPPSGKRRYVNLELGLENYSLATRAHDDRRPVLCKGEIVRTGKITTLKNITRFDIAPEIDEEEGPVGPIFDQ